MQNRSINISTFVNNTIFFLIRIKKKQHALVLHVH